MRWLAGVLATSALALWPSVVLAADQSAESVDAVIVTARKRPENVIRIPESVTAFSRHSITDLELKRFADVATMTPDLSFAYGNGSTAIGDARTIAVRGVSGPNTTGVYIDETPVPDSIDPRLVDLERIEVLRGPQGTLYGDSSLGGNVKFVSPTVSLDEPSLWIEGDAGATSHGGSPDIGAQAAGTLVLAPGRAALRASGFWDQEAGYLNRGFPDPSGIRRTLGDQGSQRSWGGSLALRTRVDENLEVMFRLIVQDLRDKGFPAAFAPLPAFEPVSTLDRPFNLQPYMSDQWLLPSVTLGFQRPGWRIDSSTSYLQRSIAELEDSTVGTAQAVQGFGVTLPAQPFGWRAKRERRQVAHETRVTFDPDRPLSAVAGVFVSSAKDDFVIPPIMGQGLSVTGAWPNDLLWRSDIRDSQQDIALFGEAYLRFWRGLTLTVGARQYWLRQSYQLVADGFLDGGLSDGGPGKNAESGLSPKVALSWESPDQTIIYASASKGFRAGGSGQAVIPACDASLQQIGLTEDSARKYDSDEVWSYEVGAKKLVDGGRLLLTTTAYSLDWNHIQQNVFLPSCAFIITANAGAAEADGAEFELSGEPTHGFQVRLGIGIENARITKVGDTGQSIGARVYQVPRANATAAFMWRHNIGRDLVGLIAGDYSWVGDSISNNGGGTLQLVRPAYALLNARIGLERGRSSLILSLRNITNVRPNLGDIGYIGYEQFNSTGEPLPQVVTEPPFNARIEVKQVF